MGKSKSKSKGKGRNRHVVVIDRGWIFAGDVTDRRGRVYLRRPVWVFGWDRVGFAAVIADPVGTKADIRLVQAEYVDVPAGAEIYRVPVGDDWGL